jgi:hypothetical protein
MNPFPADDVPVFEIREAIQFHARLLAKQAENLEERGKKYEQRVEIYLRRRENFEKGVSEMQAHGRKILVKNPVVLEAEFQILEYEVQALAAEYEAMTLADSAHDASCAALKKKHAIANAVLCDVTVLKTLKRHGGHVFMQSDNLGPQGHCSAYGLEYVHWRRAGLSVDASLSQLTRSTAFARLRQTQQDIRHDYFSCMTRTFSRTPQRRSTQAYVRAFEGHHARMQHDLKFSGRPMGNGPVVESKATSPSARDAKLSGPHLPALELTTRSSLTVHGSVPIRFSFAMLPYIWPASVFRPWVKAEADAALKKFKSASRFADMKVPKPPLEMSLTRPPVMADPGSLAQKPQLPVPEEKKGMSNSAHQAHSAEKVARQYKEWRCSIKSELDAIFKGAPPSGFLLCFIDIPMHWGHFVVIDLMASPPGIFDPNYGFLSMHSNQIDDQFFYWLLALLLAHYEVQRIDFMHVPAGE